MAVIVNVDDFPGTTDLEKIQNAINSIISTGGIVLFPKRTYNIDPTGSIVVYSNMQLVGNGATLFQQNNTTVNDSAPIITINSSSENIKIGGLKFDGNKLNQKGNFARGISCGSGKNIEIYDCEFGNIRRVAILMANVKNFKILNVFVNVCGIEDIETAICVGIEVYSSGEMLIENFNFSNSWGVGCIVHDSKDIILRNHFYTDNGLDNGITVDTSSDLIIENVDVSNMANQGIEINNIDRFKLTNINSRNNGVYNLLISSWLPSSEPPTEKACTFGEISNVYSYNSNSEIGINIIGSHHLSLNNIHDNKKIRFIKSVLGGDVKDVELKNSTLNAIDLIEAKNVTVTNCTYSSFINSGSTYSIINDLNKLDLYTEADLNNQQFVDINIPYTTSGGATFFTGILIVDNTFVQSSGLQYTTKTFHVKLIWNELLKTAEMSVINGQIPRPFEITGGSNQIRLKNISGVATTLKARLTGISTL